MARDHYGLTPRDWALPQPAPGDPTPYTEARAAGFEAGKALLAAAVAKAEAKAEEEQRFNDAVEWLRGELSDGDTSGLPSGSSICLTLDPMDRNGEKARAIAVTLYPLDPMTIEEAVKSGLFPYGRFARYAYERMVREAGLGSLVKMQYV
jgi:hypothetical protein